MSKADLGVKRRCAACDTPFYDMRRDPIRCPSCGTVYKIDAARARPGARRAARPAFDRMAAPKPIVAKASDQGSEEEEDAVLEPDELEDTLLDDQDDREDQDDRDDDVAESDGNDTTDREP